ncbi:MAG: hypothetical protein JSV68_24835 [Anaerolineaceae bacterium]|nr:MAG: hypothetical protein JSV68_24835 [Anaerolineaceae bacterium]
MTEKRWLVLIITSYLILGFIYALTTPAFEASDELWHFPMVRHLADGNPLPVQVFDPSQVGPWRQEASQPPLYYYLGAALTFWLDTSDMAQVRIENPHVDNGLITQDGNINLVVHDPRANPWQGTLLAVRIVRIFSVLLGAATVFLTYRIASAVEPKRLEIALGAASVNAFLPMFLFISGAVNNDNLAIMLASLALYLMIRMAIGNKASVPEDRASVPHVFNSRQEAVRWLLLGLVIGMALLTKEGTIGLLPLALGTAFVRAWQLDRPRSQNKELDFPESIRWLAKLVARALLTFILVLLPVILVAGWWYYRNLQLYGEWLGWNAFIAVLGQRGHPASLIQLWGERRGFLMAYWGLFGGVNVPMSSWIYTVLNSLLVLSVVGFVIYFVRLLKQWVSQTKGKWRSFSSLINNPMLLIASRFALIACLLLALAVILGLVRWATTTWSSQGRLVFTAISALSVLFMVGLVGWLPHRAAKWIAFGVGMFMLTISAVAPLLWIRPAYQPLSYTPPHPYVLNSSDISFDNQIRLVGVAVNSIDKGGSQVEPGDTFWVHLEWELLEPMEENWSVFVHLIDPVLGRPIAQRDMYLGQGLLLTSWLEPGQRLVNSYRLQVPETAVAPTQLEVAAGLYDFYSGKRLPIDEERDNVVLAMLQLEPVSGKYPNPVTVNFEEELELVGYDIEQRRAVPGEKIDLTLYWRARRPLTNDYTFFAQIVDEDTTRWASHDFAPPEGTSTWQPDEVQTMSLTLTLDENSEPNLYPIVVGIYTQTQQGDFDRLQIQTSDGRLTDDYLELTLVRVDQ